MDLTVLKGLCRQMVHGLHKLGLRVVLDVVYNHTFHSLEDGTFSSPCAIPEAVHKWPSEGSNAARMK